jgi:hypothetical protein
LLSAAPRPLLESVADGGEILSSVVAPSVPFAGMVHRFLSGILASVDERYELAHPGLKEDSQP